MENEGDKFQQQTKYDPYNIGRRPAWKGQMPEPYKRYEGKPIIRLPETAPTHISLEEALKRRKSVRNFVTEPLSIAELSFLLWAATGIQRIEAGYKFRTAPSAGALYPIETYLVANRVEDIEQGIYHYAVERHQLEQLATGDCRRKVSTAALGQSFCADAAVVFVFSAVFDRCKFKYGQRAYRYIYIEAGHIAQNLALAAVSLGLGSCHIGAFYDDAMNSLLALDGTAESVIYLTAVGRGA